MDYSARFFRSLIPEIDSQSVYYRLCPHDPQSQRIICSDVAERRGSNWPCCGRGAEVPEGYLHVLIGPYASTLSSESTLFRNASLCCTGWQLGCDVSRIKLEGHRTAQNESRRLLVRASNTIRQFHVLLSLHIMQIIIFTYNLHIQCF